MKKCKSISTVTGEQCCYEYLHDGWHSFSEEEYDYLLKKRNYDVQSVMQGVTMNKEWKQQANIAAAKVLGLDIYDVTKRMVLIDGGVKPYEFTIFDDSIEAKAARDDVVQALGEKYGINIIANDNGTQWTYVTRKDRATWLGDDRTTAIGYACIAVVGD